MVNQILESLSNLRYDGHDWQEGFKTAIKIAMAIENVNDKKIEQLEHEISMLCVRIATLECKRYTPWTYYTTCTSPTYEGTTTTSGTK